MTVEKTPSFDILDKLMTPEDIARRITESSGVRLTGRTVWEKARRIGVAKKIGRSMLISVDDILALLREEDKKAQREKAAIAGRALEELKRSRKKLQKARLEKMK
jgi:hypothetical protein